MQEIYPMKHVLSLIICIQIFVTATALSQTTVSEAIPPETNLRIYSEMVPCHGFEGQTQCYRIQEGAAIGSDQWEMSYIRPEGLEFKPGHIHNLLIKTVKDTRGLKDMPLERVIVVRLLSLEKAE